VALGKAFKTASSPWNLVERSGEGLAGSAPQAEK